LIFIFSEGEKLLFVSLKLFFFVLKFPFKEGEFILGNTIGIIEIFSFLLLLILFILLLYSFSVFVSFLFLLIFNLNSFVPIAFFLICDIERLFLNFKIF
jgi:hypothetical protein